MKTGVVISLNVGGLGNKIFKTGDRVNERNFPEGNWDRIVKGGHVKEDGAKTEYKSVEPDPQRTDLGEPETKDPFEKINMGGKKNNKK